MRHPSIKVHPVNKRDGTFVARRRCATIHYHPSSEIERFEDLYLFGNTLTVEARLDPDGLPRLKICEVDHPGCPEGCNVVHHRNTVALDVPRLMALRALADVEVTAEPEEVTPDGQFSDERDVQWARDQVAAGNEWGWCCAKATATYGGFTGVAYLGGCSYRSRADFLRTSGDDLIGEALADLEAQIERAGHGDGARRRRP